MCGNQTALARGVIEGSGSCHCCTLCFAMWLCVCLDIASTKAHVLVFSFMRVCVCACELDVAFQSTYYWRDTISVASTVPVNTAQLPSVHKGKERSNECACRACYALVQWQTKAVPLTQIFPGHCTEASE